MTPAIHLKYKRVPPFFFLRVPLYAFWGKSKVFHSKESIPPITVKLDGMKINRTHLSRFNKICNIKNSEEISLIYPITLVFPFFQRILSLKQAPLSMFNVLGKHLKIVRHRQIGLDEALDIFCKITGVKIVSKGLEIDLSAVIKVAGETVWTATETFFYRGDFGETDTDVEDTVFESILKAKVIAKWFLPGGNGFRFARISGDGNGVHYSKFYARLLGFKRDFAQPFLILGNAINHLINNEGNNTISLNVAFKGQFYYERNVTVKGIKKGIRNRFDIYSEGNDRPCINGILAEKHVTRGGNMIAYCGLNCSKCDAYLATQENDEMKREETAQKWSKMYRAEIKTDQINCNGCKSNGVKFFHCNNCDIRACCLKKGVENCAACEDYICKTLSGFIKLAPEAGRGLAQLRM